MSALEIRGLRKAFGGVVALDGVDISADVGEILGIVGPNGSGKTTLFNVVAGALKPSGGKITWLGEEIGGLAAHRIARKGLVRTYQQAMSFPELTVAENIMIASEHGATGVAPLMTPGELLTFVGLSGRGEAIAGSMPFGNLRRLGIALALAARPKLLLLDEPAAGLNDSETAQLAEIITALPSRGLGVCLIDHDMNLIASICRRLVVLDFGTKIAEGTPTEVLNDRKVMEVYLGSAGMTLLTVSGVDTAYGPVHVNRDVSLEVAEGEVVTILGPNGAGKSTLLKAICGAIRPLSGRILVDGRDVTGQPPDRLAAAGIVMVPEGRRIFADLTVEENLRLGAYSRRDQTGVAADIKRMQDIFAILARKRSAKGGTLSGGQQQMLAIARGLMARPRLLLLDEPSLGLSPLMVKELQSVIADVRRNFGAAVLLVEQNASLAFAVASRGYLMQSGRIVAADSIEALRHSRLMRDLYLGESQGEASIARRHDQPPPIVNP